VRAGRGVCRRSCEGVEVKVEGEGVEVNVEEEGAVGEEEGIVGEVVYVSYGSGSM
jgi:hypothetical protein